MGGLCRAVPLLVCSALAAGCHESHTIFDGMRCRVPPGMVCCNAADLPETPWESLCPFECPIGMRLVGAAECGPGALDAGAAPDASFPDPIDAGPDPIDAGPPPPLECPPRRAIGACSPAPGLVAVRGVPFEVPYRIDECACCPRTECAVAGIDPRARILSLTTTLCPDPCDCAECAPAGGTCAVPGLPVAGDWEVHVNGEAAVILPVRDRAGGPPNPSGCATFALGDACDESEPLAATPWPPTDVCVRERFARTVIELRDDCAACDHQGACLSYFIPDERGGELHVSATRYAGACDGACDPICVDEVRYCEIPDLPGEGLYRILVDGEERALLGLGRFADRTTSCVGG